MRAEDWWVRRSTDGTNLIAQSGLVMCRCQSFAPLCATAFEHKLPTFGAHSHTEAVCFGTSAIVRLKGPLHVTMLLENVSAENSKTIEATLVCQGSERSDVDCISERWVQWVFLPLEARSSRSLHRPSSNLMALNCARNVSNSLSEVARSIFDSSTILAKVLDCSKIRWDIRAISS
jgi:hypothetical protein